MFRLSFNSSSYVSIKFSLPPRVLFIVRTTAKCKGCCKSFEHIWIRPKVGRELGTWRCSTWDGHLHYATTRVGGLMFTCLWAGKLSDSCQQHQEFPSSLPYCPGPILLNFSDKEGTDVSSMEGPLALGTYHLEVTVSGLLNLSSN